MRRPARIRDSAAAPQSTGWPERREGSASADNTTAGGRCTIEVSVFRHMTDHDVDAIYEFLRDSARLTWHLRSAREIASATTHGVAFCDAVPWAPITRR